MCGLPFAGKSTAARSLAVSEDAEIVELDAINAELGLGAVITPEQWARSYAASFDRLQRILATGQSAIFDATNFTRSQRDRLRQIASGAGADAVIAYVPIERSEAERRWLTNRRTGARPDVRDTDFTLVADGFEPPDDDEAVRIIG